LETTVYRTAKKVLLAVLIVLAVVLVLVIEKRKLGRIIRYDGEHEEEEKLNPKSEIQNPKSKIRNPKSKIRNPKSEIRNPKSEIQNPKSKINIAPLLRKTAESCRASQLPYRGAIKSGARRAAVRRRRTKAGPLGVDSLLQSPIRAMASISTNNSGRARAA
jgi:hypothetical protein